MCQYTSLLYINHAHSENNLKQFYFRYLGVASSYQILAEEVRHKPDFTCSKLQFLQPHQREICSHDFRLLDVISKGASMGIEECQFQFQDRRWNCTTYNNTSVFGPLLQISEQIMRFSLFACVCLSRVYRVQVDQDYSAAQCWSQSICPIDSSGVLFKPLLLWGRDSECSSAVPAYRVRNLQQTGQILKMASTRHL